MTGSIWRVEHQRTTAAAFHDTELTPRPGERRVVDVAVSVRALVLGSTQRADVVDADAAAAAGLEVVRRRSGGGAVVLVPGEHVWFDVVIARDDPRWTDDVSASSQWLGEAWATALAETTDATPVVHAGAMQRNPLSGLVCFAGLAPGEVTIGGAKAVGISQRRTRDGARFQCVALRRWDPAAYATLLRPVSVDDLAAVAVAPISASPAALRAAVERALPR